MNKSSIENIARKTERYWFEDGIWEMGFGLINVLLAGFFLLVSAVDWKGPLAFVLLVLQLGVFYAVFFTINKVVKFLKERITYPRTGFVAYRKPPPRTRLTRAVRTILIAASVGGLVGLVATMHAASNRTPLVVAVVMAGALVYLAYRFDLLRLYAVAVLVVLLGYGISLVPLSNTLDTAAFFGGFGLLMLLFGGFTLINYLRHTSPAEDTMDYEANHAGE